jgi:hypothetical protein
MQTLELLVAYDLDMNNQTLYISLKIKAKLFVRATAGYRKLSGFAVMIKRNDDHEPDQFRHIMSILRY